jgi:toxin ParE1/3/4
MASEVRWTLRAIGEAENWIDWLDRQNRRAALKASHELVLRTTRLAQFPELGRTGRIKGTRELSLQKWKKIVVYKATQAGVSILTLRDARQNPEA